MTMDIAHWGQVFFSTDLPVLPQQALARWALPLAWGVLLATAVLALGARWKAPLRWLLALSVLGWSLWPGPVSPAYWLGLAFQSPSLMSVALCLAWLAGRRPAGVAWRVLGGAGVFLGWVLLLDMLAWWPLSLYAWGFSPVALAMMCAGALLCWLIWGATVAGRLASVLLAAVLGVFVLTRLPSGNVWDALLDPWLWLVLQARGALWAWRGLRARITSGRAATATRA